MAGSDHQNNDINIINISTTTTTNITNTKRHDGLKDKGIIISSRITGPTKLNYRQHCSTFVNKTITYLLIKRYPMTQDNGEKMVSQGRIQCWPNLDGAFNAEVQCHDDDGGGGGSIIGTFASSTRSGKEFRNENLILPPDLV